MENSVTLLYIHVLWNMQIKPLTYFLPFSAFRFGENIENPLLAYEISAATWQAVDGQGLVLPSIQTIF